MDFPIKYGAFRFQFSQQNQSIDPRKKTEHSHQSQHCDRQDQDPSRHLFVEPKQP